MANLIQALYGAVDLMVIGWYCPPESVAAVSTGTQVTQIITSMISGLTLGGTVLVGKYVGRNQPDNVKDTIATNLSVFAIAGILLTFLLLAFVSPILTALKTPEASFLQAKQYVSACACGVIFICGYNAISATLRGYGDSKSPLLFVAVSGCLNLSGDIILVKHLDMGIPISLQECMVRLSFLYLTSVTNQLGVSAAAAVGIASKYDVFAMLPATSAANALATIVAQNYGAGKYKRMNQALAVAILFALPFSTAFFLWAQINPASMIRLFSDEPAIISAGIPFFKTCSFDYLCVLLVFTLNGYLNGRSKTMFTMVSCCFGALALRMPFIYIVCRYAPDQLVLLVFTLNGYLNGRSKTMFTMVSCCFGALALRMPFIYIVCRYAPDQLGIIGMVAPAVSGIMAVYTLIYVLGLIKRTSCHYPH